MVSELDIQIRHRLIEALAEKERLTAELRKAKEASDAANRAKGCFLAIMSHEIRTPLNGILGMAQLLLMPELAEDERCEYARTILNSGQTLLTLLNDILDFSKIEAGRLDLSHAVFDPWQIVEETTALYAEIAQTKGLTIETAWHGPRMQRYKADPVRLRQMLSNLVSNALKFTSRGFVRVEAAEVGRTENAALLEFAVTDSGIGIPADRHPLLFVPFSQIDASITREYGGTGLGLSIVHDLARLMGGEVGVESNPGKGARFWFRIRADLVHGGDESRQAGFALRHDGEAKGATGRILVVEDNPVNRKVAVALLRKLGLHAETVENGQEAVDALMRGMRPDAVLMDVQMPVMDGLRATECIRHWEKESRQPHTPIIALTAGAFEEDRKCCIACGMDDFLAKPVGMNDLGAVLAKWVGREEGKA